MRAVTLLVCSVLAWGACSRSDATRAPGKAQETKPERASVVTPPKPPLASIERPDVSVPDALAWLAFGGGSDPLSNQVSLKQDLAVLASSLDGPGLTLFASGPGAMLSLEAPPRSAEPHDVRDALARVLGVPGTPETRYEPADLAIDGPATAEHVLRAFEQGLPRAKSPLFVYVASHGEQGARADENALSLWGGWPLKVHDLASALDRTPEARPTRMVITACFGGGFAELAFVGADAERGVRAPDHCGLFAAPWDDEASGCDPNPDRRAQESYSIHFLHALAGEDRSRRNRMKDIDLDGDARVSLLEAHTWARTQARSFDIPTTTSERYLREVVRPSEKAELDPLAAPEEVAVIRALGGALELDDEQAARDKLTELDRVLEDARALADEAQRAADDTYYALRIALVERWPLLEHPWEARTQALLRKEGRAILRMITSSELSAAHAHAARELDEAVAQEDAVRVERARVLRLVRAFETLRLASALERRGGEASRHFRALRSCERWVPPLKKRRGQPSNPL